MPKSALRPRTMRTADVAAMLGQSVDSLRALATSPENAYKTHLEPKPTGGHRLISVPSPTLKQWQRRFLRLVLARLASPRDLRAIVQKDHVKNARTHRAKRHVLTLDIADAFPSTSPRIVQKRLRDIGFTADCARLICRLCLTARELPQGAPTSNAILDIVLIDFDRALIRACAHSDSTYTRYSDNLAFSSTNPLQGIERYAVRALKGMSYAVRDDKTQHGGAGVQVDITGIQTAKSLLVRPSTIERTQKRMKEAILSGEGVYGPAVAGAFNYVRRVNRRQASALLRSLPDATG